MGKGKAKKLAPTPVGDEVFKPSAPTHCTCGHEHPRAADGHNVDGWTAEDIRIYNELLTERAKLEKEKNELEQKSARHQAERALLNEDAAAFDKLFKAELGGEYKFTGKTVCCLDMSSDTRQGGKASPTKDICHHEICGRAKTQGVSWMEMDTIKYYQSRITSEKSQRMKNALRKQRDVELGRVKKEEEEESALRNRRLGSTDRSPSRDTPCPHHNDVSSHSLLDAFGSKDSALSPKDNAILDAAKENELVVKKIRSRLDKIRHDVHAGKVTPGDARAKLDQANKEMAEAERKNNTFKELIFTTGTGQDSDLFQALTNSLVASSADAFSQALNVMKGFFSASDPQDVQAAISDLRNVLEFNGPMAPVLRKSFQALQDMLAKPNAKGFSVDLTGADGTKRTATNVVEVLLMLRNPQDRSTLDSTAKELKIDKKTLAANEECMKIEREAIVAISEVARGYNLSEYKKIYDELKEIKNKASLKSPIPPLSDIVLEKKIEQILYGHTMFAIFERCRAGASEQELRATITSIVIYYSDKNVHKFMQTLAKLEEEARRLHVEIQKPVQSLKDADDAECLQSEIEVDIEIINNALAAVKASMGASVAKQQGRKKASVNGDASTGKSALLAETSILKKLVPDEPRRYSIETDEVPSKVNRTGTSYDDLSIDILRKASAGLTNKDIALAITAGLPNTPQAQRLKKDLEMLASMPDGKEDAAMVERIQRDISHFAKLDKQDHGQKQKEKQANSKMKVKGHTSKFQEELTTGDEPSPPPYSANEGRTRTVKVKQVPVNTPQISDQPSNATNSTDAQITASLQKTAALEAAAEVSENLQKMRKDLQSLTKLPGMDGAKATKLRKQLDSVMEQIDDLNVWRGEQNSEDGDSIKGKGKEPEHLSNDTSSLDISAEKNKNNKKKRGKKETTNGTTVSPVAEVVPVFEDALSDREETIRHQLYDMKENIVRLLQTAPPSAAKEYGIPDAFNGIMRRLVDQMNGHVATALLLCDGNDWTGLKTWVEKEFRVGAQ